MHEGGSKGAEERSVFLCAFCEHYVRSEKHKLSVDGEEYDICEYCAELLKKWVRVSLSGNWKQKRS